jgi:hypothetical protein
MSDSTIHNLIMIIGGAFTTALMRILIKKIDNQK